MNKLTTKMTTTNTISIKDGLKILQWNARSIRKNKSNLSKYLNDNPSDIVLLSETWLKPTNQDFNFNNYSLVCEDRLGQRAGGVGILISNSLAYQNVIINNPPNNGLDICAIYLTEAKINVICIYRPQHVKMNYNTWKDIFAQFSNVSAIVGGDFKCHLKLLGFN